MNTGPNAVQQLIRRTATRRLATDPADAQLFDSRELDRSRRRTPRGSMDWRPPPPEPVVRRPVARKPRTRWKLLFFVSAMAIAGGIAASRIGFSGDDMLATHPSVAPPQRAAVAAPAAPPPEPTPPAPSPPPPLEPTIAPTPTDDAAPAAAVPTVTHVKRRPHPTRRAAKPARAAAVAPAPAPTKPAPHPRHSAQSDDTENPL